VKKPTLEAAARSPAGATPPAASINRIRLVDLPGVQMDEAVRGQQAYHLLSGPALIRYAQAAGADLALPAALQMGDPTAPHVRRELPRLVDVHLRHPDPTVRRAARSIARRLGRNLGYILLALQRGDPATRAARPDWPPEAWATWVTIRRVWLGGGIVSGELGAALIDHANALLTAVAEPAQPPPLTIQRTPRPTDMAILGAGRALTARSARRWHALVLDLGQTSAKRAVATVTEGVITRLTWLPTVPVSWRWRNDPAAGEGIDGRAVRDFVARTLVEGWAAAEGLGLTPEPEVAISIAAYTQGKKLLGNGIYARIHRLGGDAHALIGEQVVALCGTKPTLHIIHDGTAAAALHAGEPHSAVIVVGTALGAGFPPASERGLRRIAPEIEIVHAAS
jgi:hypothetical protein